LEEHALGKYQDRRENLRGPGQIFSGGPMTSLFLS
jgi:hypothetical protein